MVDSKLLGAVVAQGDITRAPKEALLIATSTKEASCTPTSTPSSRHFYVRVDDLLPRRQGPGRPPRITDAELIALAVAQM